MFDKRHIAVKTGQVEIVICSQEFGFSFDAVVESLADILLGPVHIVENVIATRDVIVECIPYALEHGRRSRSLPDANYIHIGIITADIDNVRRSLEEHLIRNIGIRKPVETFISPVNGQRKLILV